MKAFAKRFALPAALLLPVLSSCGGGGAAGGGSGALRFEVLIDNIADASTLSANGGPVPVVFSPFLLAVHGSGDLPMFQSGSLAPQNGLESFAEDGDISAILDSLQQDTGIALIGIGATPVGTSEAGLLLPGASYRIVIAAAPGQSLTVAGAFLQGNDLLVASPDSGIPLFSGDTPVSGDVTARMSLVDIGTERNEAPGTGPNQGLRQSAPNQGAAETVPVAPVSDGFAYPAVASMLRVTIRPLPPA